MKVLLTGGAGDLGQSLCPQLLQAGHSPVVLDVRRPTLQVESFEGSITDKEILKTSMAGVDLVVHIAAWHGIHEFRKQRNVSEFWDLNVTGTFNVFQAAAEAKIDKFIFLSSTSIRDRHGLYGHTKILGEEIARTYAVRHGMNVITLRPRAFIPHWNRDVYKTYLEWCNWFWTGAVHIQDVTQSVVKSVNVLTGGTKLPEAVFLTVDGAYDYTDNDLVEWDKDGTGSTFKRYYPQYYDLALKHGLDVTRKPKKLDIDETRKVIGYSPEYSLKNLLSDLETYGADGPPAPNAPATIA